MMVQMKTSYNASALHVDANANANYALDVWVFSQHGHVDVNASK